MRLREVASRQLGAALSLFAQDVAQRLELGLEVRRAPDQTRRSNLRRQLPTLDVLIVSAQEQDGDAVQLSAFPQLATQAEAVRLSHDDVAQDGVRDVCLSEIETFLCRRGRGDDE